MFMASKKPVSNEAKTFSRWFRKKVRDPFIDIARKDKRVADFIDEVLPGRLWSSITRAESNPQINSLGKKHLVEREVATMLQGLGIQWLRPFILKYLDHAVFFIYRDYFMKKFKRWGLHEPLELLLDKDIDEDGDIGDAKPGPLLEPVEPPPPDEKPKPPAEPATPAKKPTTKKAAAAKKPKD